MLRRLADAAKRKRKRKRKPRTLRHKKVHVHRTEHVHRSGRVHVHRKRHRHWHDHLTHHRKKKKRKPAARPPVLTAPPPAPPPEPPPEPPPPAPAPPPAQPVVNGVPVYTGPFERRHAERLLWRAGFGPTPGQADALVAKGLEAAVQSLTRPAGEPVLLGPEPNDGTGAALSPFDRSGHDHLWWLDRMVRSDHQLIERMTLVWHDWFATSNQGVFSQRLMIGQNELFRRLALGSFRDLTIEATRDPAMLLWLNGNVNRKGKPDENYARELMELFTLGADRGAYSEGDVREMARALTGFRNDFTNELGAHNFRFDPARHDAGSKAIFGRTGNFGWEDACRLCLEHPLHPSFLVTKLWSYFVPTPPSEGVRVALEERYRQEGYAVLPLVEAILMHPDFHEGPPMIKPPVVLAAGLLRALGRGVDSSAWTSLCEQSGQRLFYPPDVAGWDDTRWLDTNTVRGRWLLVSRSTNNRFLPESAPYDPAEAPDAALYTAAAFWGFPPLTPETVGVLSAFASTCLPAYMTDDEQRTYRIHRQNALRQLIATSPDSQTS